MCQQALFAGQLYDLKTWTDRTAELHCRRIRATARCSATRARRSAG